MTLITAMTLEQMKAFVVALDAEQHGTDLEHTLRALGMDHVGPPDESTMLTVESLDSDSPPFCFLFDGTGALIRSGFAGQTISHDGGEP